MLEGAEDALHPRLLYVGTAPAKQPGRHQWREGKRNNSAGQNRDHDGDRELAEDSAHESAHEYQGDEDCGQRKRHGQDGEADLLGRVQRCFEGVLPLLHQTDGVFEKHDGIVHEKADRQGESHQGKIIQAVAQQTHRYERQK